MATLKTEAVPTVAEARAEVQRLRQLALGIAESRWIQRTSRRHFITGEGVAAEADITEDVLETDPAPDGLARLRAQQALPAAEQRLLEAEVQQEQARQRAAVDERVAREAVVAEGEALVRRELPRLLRETRQVQQAWQAFEAKCAALDQRLGQARFTEAAWGFVMAPGAQFDAFVAYCREAYGLNLD